MSHTKVRDFEITKLHSWMNVSGLLLKILEEEHYKKIFYQKIIFKNFIKNYFMKEKHFQN